MPLKELPMSEPERVYSLTECKINISRSLVEAAISFLVIAQNLDRTGLFEEVEHYTKEQILKYPLGVGSVLILAELLAEMSERIQSEIIKTKSG